MIIFHEGLPRSGKSYEAMVKHVIPAIRKGRKVFAYVAGIDHAKIAEVTELSLEHVQEHIIQLTKEQLPKVFDHVEDKSLVVLDEMQDTWPSTRQKLPPDITEFITQHGHREIDIIGMGQDLKDVHSMWRRRVDKKVQFTKRDVIGRPSEYTWRTLKQQQPDKWVEIMSGKGTYEPKYFGIYASHSTSDPEGQNYEDKRAVIWNHPKLKYGIPAVLVIAFFSMQYVWGFFHQDLKAEAESKPEKPAQIQHSPQHPPVQQPIRTVETKPVQPPQEDKKAHQEEEEDEPLTQSLKKGRARLVGMIKGKHKTEGLMQVLEPGSFRELERFSFAQLRSLGWHIWIDETDSMIIIRRGAKQITVTQWPIEPIARVSSVQSEAMRGDRSGTNPASPNHDQAQREPVNWEKAEGFPLERGSS